MGRLTALTLKETDVSIEMQIWWHLQGNHYPPVPVEMVKPCLEAIDAFWEEDLGREIAMPKVNDFQILYQGGVTAPAYAIIDQHHLHAWCEDEDEDY
jgi:hypothetical protein